MFLHGLLTFNIIITGYGSRNRSLRNYERKTSNEQVTEKNENDPLGSSVNKLRREGKIHSNDVSEVSDGFRTPDESIASEILDVPDFVKEGEDSLSDRLGRSSYLSSSGRRSANKEPYEDKSGRYTSARPVARRSVSRELFDLKYNTGKISPSPYHSILSEQQDPLSSALSPPSRRISRISREGSSSRDTADSEAGLSSAGGYSRSISLSRGPGGLGSDPLSPNQRYQPSRPTLSSAGRSGTQNEIMRNSPLTVMRHGDEDGYLGGNLRDRKRDDWRRISVPERGKDFNSLPRKYTR